MSGQFYHQFKKKGINNDMFDEKTDIITYEDLLKDPNLDKETKLRYEKLKLERDRKLIIDKLDKLKIEKLKSNNK
jgi:hypothetical protein